MDGQDRQDGGPLGRNQALSSAMYGGRGARIALDCGLRRNDEGQGAIHRAPTEKPTLVRGQPPYGPPAAAGGRVSPAGGGQEAATVLLKVPRPVISTSTTSPAWRYTSCTEPTPAGVPVAMTSPGERVMNLLIHSMVSAM